MMIWLKKRFAFFLCIALVFLFISGCGCLMPDMPCVPGVRQSFLECLR